tara:strand:+ start:3416 stop:4495 length:1080 start_codon:yes stop_codon:yes gene_type:complete
MNFIKAYSSWQINRLRSRLLAYLIVSRKRQETFDAKQKFKPTVAARVETEGHEYNWLDLAAEICVHPKLVDLIERLKPADTAEEIDNESDTELLFGSLRRQHEDAGMPITRNMIEKFVQGERKTDKQGNTYWHFTSPKDVTVLNVYEEFIRSVGFLGEDDLEEHADEYDPVMPFLQFLNFGAPPSALPINDLLSGDYTAEEDTQDCCIRRKLALSLDEKGYFHRVRQWQYIYETKESLSPVESRQMKDRGDYDRKVQSAGWASRTPDGVTFIFLQDELYDEYNNFNIVLSVKTALRSSRKLPEFEKATEDQLTYNQSNIIESIEIVEHSRPSEGAPSNFARWPPAFTVETKNIEYNLDI